MGYPDELVRFLAERTHLPSEVIWEIYRAGAPWPILTRQLDRMAEDDAKATGVPVETAAKALDEVCKVEEERLAILRQQAQRALLFKDPAADPFDLPEIQAIWDYPYIREMRDYSQRVAVIVGIAWELVWDVYLGIGDYAEKHPDWDPEEPADFIRPA